MDKKNNTEKTVMQFIAPRLADTVYEIYDVEYVKEGSEWYLRIFIDKEGGVDLDDCEKVTDLINAPLDELDPITEPYFLEVSSPGVERHLKTNAHFKKAVGEKVRIKTFAKVADKKEWIGILQDVRDDAITLNVDGKTLDFPLDMIAKANISVF